jgi:putative ABC transport system ATP-binding protein
VSKAYGDSPPVLDAVNACFDAGQVVAILGESGAGKSTLLNLIAGLDVPDAGEIHIAGELMDAAEEASAARIRRERIGFVFQSFLLLPYLDLASNVALPLLLLDKPPAARAAATANLLDRVGLGSKATAMPRTLSGGEQQRAAIARALIHAPALVLADEPTGNLDAGNAAVVLDLLRDLVVARSTLCLLVTHSEQAARRADQVWRLTGGALVRLQ